MEKSFQIKNYFLSKLEILSLALFFIFFFFQAFPFYIGPLKVFYYYPALIFIYIIGLQIAGYQKFIASKEYILIYTVFALWIFYTAISIFWSIDHQEAIRMVFLRFISFFCFYVMTQFFTNNKRITFFELFVIISLIFNIFLAFYSVTTLQHLPTSKQYGRIHFVPTGAFFNENDFASALLICTPVLFFIKGKIKQHIAAVIILILFLVISIQGARLILIAYIPFMIWFLYKKTHILFKISTLVLTVSLVSYILMNYSMIRFMVNKQIDEHILSFGTELQSQRLGSMEIRVELYKIALEKFTESKGLGVGAGNIESTLSPYRTIPTTGIPNIHSLFFETLANEGVIGFSCLIFITFYSLLILKKIRFYDGSSKYKILCVVLFFVFSVSVPSSIKGVYIYWTMLGYAYALLFHQQEAKAGKELLIVK